ncbi:hypothetical protein RF11_01684 [Thelohanellus kitauei]|uniref:Uncharacterized protein n=1 Tax=Thelohanellus kitauei TaxID=669202 RepID=A0A0C2JDV6_THEKT|nr:hypothetical protein RF11_10084 [Thelohanellus kitauei]KII67398.1 hypothetical protein RF11_01684 [Thelohanellus kitauei]
MVKSAQKNQSQIKNPFCGSRKSHVSFPGYIHDLVDTMLHSLFFPHLPVLPNFVIIATEILESESAIYFDLLRYIRCYNPFLSSIQSTCLCDIYHLPEELEGLI